MIDWRQAAIGTVALLAGVAVYLVDRPAGQLAGVPTAWFLWDGETRILGRLGGVLPDFLHPFGFAMLTGSLLQPDRRRYLTACAAWALADAIFEVGQHPLAAAWIETSLAPINSQFPPLSWLTGYVRNGAFDPFDLLAIFAGAAVAFWLLLKTAALGERDEI